MTSFRWGLGIALAALSLVAAGQAVAVYMDHQLWLGVLAVVVLGAMDVFGFASLAAARWRLHKELRGLDAETPGGALFTARKERLEAMVRRGVAPDVHALADATHAEETGRAYLGRYMVAVTVLVGLVGTFAGLMETLHGVAPLVQDEKATVLSLALPLAGLDVTFGASIVGILVTLALSLVQGDLVLAEDMVLARLHERTVHVLIPALWPRESLPDARMAADVSGLRKEIASAVVAMAEAAADKVSRVASLEVERLVREVRESLGSSVKDTTAQMRTGMLEVVGTLDAKLQPVLAEEARLMAETRSVLGDVGAQVAKALGASSEAAVKGLEQAAAHTVAAQEQASARTVAAQEQVLLSLEEVVDRTERAMREMTTAHVDQMKTATDAVASPAQAAVTRMEKASALMESGVERILSRSSEVQDRLLNAADARLGKHVEETRALLSGAGSEVTRAITAAAESAVQGMATADAATRGVLEQAAARSAEAHEQMLQGFQHQSTALRTTLDTLAERTSGVLQHLSETHAQELKSTTALVAGPAQAAMERMEHASALMEGGMERILARSTDVQDRLLAAADEKLSRHVEETRVLLVGAGADVARAITGATQSAVEGIAKADAATREALEHASQQAAALHVRLLEDSRQQSAELQSAFHGVAERTAGSLEQLTHAHVSELQAASAAVVKSSQATVDGVDKLLATVTESLTRVANRVDGMTSGVQVELFKTVEEVQGALQSSQQAHAGQLSETAEALKQVVHATLTEAGDKLRAAAESLALSVGDLNKGTAALTPSVATLAPELQALSREVALLAARADAEEEQGAVLDEMARLGEGMNRLEGLLRLAQGGQG